eukprot:g2085.t1
MSDARANAVQLDSTTNTPKVRDTAPELHTGSEIEGLLPVKMHHATQVQVELAEQLIAQRGLGPQRQLAPDEREALQRELLDGTAAEDVMLDAQGHLVQPSAIVRDVADQARAAAERGKNYCMLFKFVLNFMLYLVILLMQRRPSSAYAVESAVTGTLFDLETKTINADDGRVALSVPNVPAVYNWLDKSVISAVYRDPICGDGRCEGPIEFPAGFPSVAGVTDPGCKADCGTQSSADMSQLTVSFDVGTNAVLSRLCYEQDPHSLPLCECEGQDLGVSIFWNLCLDVASEMREVCAFARTPGSPYGGQSLEPVDFKSVSVVNKTVTVFEGAWQLRLWVVAPEASSGRLVAFEYFRPAVTISTNGTVLFHASGAPLPDQSQARIEELNAAAAGGGTDGSNAPAGQQPASPAATGVGKQRRLGPSRDSSKSAAPGPTPSSSASGNKGTAAAVTTTSAAAKGAAPGTPSSSASGNKGTAAAVTTTSAAAKGAAPGPSSSQGSAGRVPGPSPPGSQTPSADKDDEGGEDGDDSQDNKGGKQTCATANLSNDRLSSKGLPLGFATDMFSGVHGAAGFPIFFDTDISESRAKTFLQYLKDGFYIDARTKSLTIEVMLYNTHHRIFCVAEVVFTLLGGGVIEMKHVVQALATELYGGSMQDNFRLALEMLWLALVGWNMAIEAGEIWHAIRKRGFLKGSAHYACDAWNIIDWANIVVQMQLAHTWLHFYQDYAKGFAPQVRYDNALADIYAKHDMLRLGAGYGGVMRMFDQVHEMNTLMSRYVALNVVSVILMTARVIKLLDFQPRLGLVTRTLAVAALDLCHFFLVFVLVLCSYGYIGHISFGPTLKRFSSFGLAISTLVAVLLGEIDNVRTDLAHLPNTGPAAFYFWSFVALAFFLLMNMLLAILVDAYVAVKKEAESTHTVIQDIRQMLRPASCSSKRSLNTLAQVQHKAEAEFRASRAQRRKLTGHSLAPDRLVANAGSQACAYLLKAGNGTVDVDVLTAALRRYNKGRRGSRRGGRREADQGADEMQAMSRLTAHNAMTLLGDAHNESGGKEDAHTAGFEQDLAEHLDEIQTLFRDRAIMDARVMKRIDAIAQAMRSSNRHADFLVHCFAVYFSYSMPKTLEREAKREAEREAKRETKREAQAREQRKRKLEREAKRDPARQRARKRQRKRYQNDKEYHVTMQLRGRLRAAVKAAGARKSAKAFELLGCSAEAVCAHLEAQFVPGMSWDNHVPVAVCGDRGYARPIVWATLIFSCITGAAGGAVVIGTEPAQGLATPGGAPPTTAGMSPVAGAIAQEQDAFSKGSHRRLATCAAGTYSAPPTLQTSGSCSVRPDSLEACWAATKQLGLSGRPISGPRDNVPGCFAYLGTRPYYNTALDSTLLCSTRNQCICGPFCTDCVSGRYTDQLGQSACKGTACPLGQAGPLASTSSSTATCTPCDAGRYSGSAVGAGACQECPRGKWSAAGASSCMACTAGRGSNETGATSDATCTVCEAGRYGGGAVGAGVCQECPRGKWQPAAGAASCTACCGADEYQDEEGKTFCRTKARCIPGEYVAEPAARNATRCAKCASGHYSSAGDAERCTQCGADEYQDEEGKTFCRTKARCIPGEYVAYAGTATSDRTCGRCDQAQGQYTSRVGQPSCETCVDGTYSIGTGCIDCPPGFGCAGGTKVACDQHNEYQSTPGASACSVCGASSYRPGGSRTTCTAKTTCIAGKYIAVAGGATSDHKCAACIDGKYQPEGAQNACLECPACNTGARANCGGAFVGVCPTCTPGNFINGTAQRCQLCPRGTYSDIVDAMNCTQCEVGFFCSRAPVSFNRLSAGSLFKCPVQGDCVTSLNTTSMTVTTLRLVKVTDRPQFAVILRYIVGGGVFFAIVFCLSVCFQQLVPSG